MAKATKTPKIRFKGFDKPWEEKRLGEIVRLERGGSPRPIEAFITNSHDGLNWIKIGDAPKIGRYITETSEKIRPEGLSKTREVFPGDLILSNSMSFGKPFIMAIHGCIHDGWLLIRNEKNIFNLIFLCHLLNTPNLIKQYTALASGSTVNNLNKELVGNTKISFPIIEEQTLIGKVLENLDTLITQQKQKHEKLKNIKKGLLEKMFPKAGSNKPEIRFKGFDEIWEKLKIGQIAKKIYGGGTPSTRIPSLWKGNIPWIQTSDLIKSRLDGIIPKKFITLEGINTSAAEFIPGNSIAIVTRVGVGKLARIPFPFSTSQDFLSLSDLITESFFSVTALYKILQSDLDKVQGTSIKGITKSELLSKEIIIPSFSEQTQIGTFFQKLDNLITLQQRKIEKLQNLKKACLEKMFV